MMFSKFIKLKLLLFIRDYVDKISFVCYNELNLLKGMSLMYSDIKSLNLNNGRLTANGLCTLNWLICVI